MADGRLGAVLVLGFVVFVGFGVAFVGTDDTPTERGQSDGGTQDSNKKVFASSLSGENVYVRSEEGVAELLVDEWIASEPHRQNIIESKWESIGVGVTVDENGTVFGTQAFCSVGG